MVVKIDSLKNFLEKNNLGQYAEKMGSFKVQGFENLLQYMISSPDEKIIEIADFAQMKEGHRGKLVWLISKLRKSSEESEVTVDQSVQQQLAQLKKLKHSLELAIEEIEKKPTKKTLAKQTSVVRDISHFVDAFRANHTKKTKNNNRIKISRYEGEYRNGKKHGKGVFTYRNGDRYEGEYRNDKKHGKGVYIYANGDRYEGEYKDGKKHGVGVYMFAARSSTQAGSGFTQTTTQTFWRQSYSNASSGGGLFANAPRDGGGLFANAPRDGGGLFANAPRDGGGLFATTGGGGLFAPRYCESIFGGVTRRPLPCTSSLFGPSRPQANLHSPFMPLTTDPQQGYSIFAQVTPQNPPQEQSFFVQGVLKGSRFPDHGNQMSNAPLSAHGNQMGNFSPFFAHGNQMGNAPVRPCDLNMSFEEARIQAMKEGKAYY